MTLISSGVRSLMLSRLQLNTLLVPQKYNTFLTYKKNGKKKLFQLVEYLKKEVDKEINDRLPRKVGVMAKKIFTQNFRDGGWRDGSIYPWQKTKNLCSML